MVKTRQRHISGLFNRTHPEWEDIAGHNGQRSKRRQGVSIGGQVRLAVESPQWKMSQESASMPPCSIRKLLR